MALDTDVAARRAIALAQATGSGKTSVSKEDIILRLAQFVNSGEKFEDHVETMWSSKPKSLNPNTKRIREIIETTEMNGELIFKNVLVGHASQFGIFLTLVEDEDEDEENEQ